MTDPTVATTIVIPTIGRPSLATLLAALDESARHGPPPAAVVVVDDRPASKAATQPLRLTTALPVEVVRSDASGPAAARNRGWRRARTPWVSFLDDDVVPDSDWLRLLAADLAEAGPSVAGSQGRVRVPLPEGRRPTDWERGTAGLATSAWITADMSYRRADLARVGGFDERFPRAFREDADLALRIQARERLLTRGRRSITHPVRAVDDWVSVRVQQGNAHDALMNRLHGPTWWERAHAPRGRALSQRVLTASLALAAVSVVARRRALVAVAVGGYAAGVLEFAWRRVRPGPADAREVRRMVLTSLVIPPVASWHALRGYWQHRHAGPWVGLPDVVLFDRDGTLIQDVPYNGDPALVAPVDGARETLDRLRELGVRVGLITNQSGVGYGKITQQQADEVNAEVDRQLGPFDVLLMCPHTPDEGCGCRKPAPGMVLQACELLDASPDRCVVVGDIARDVDAARAAGARGLLVPNTQTSPEDLAVTGETAPDLLAALRTLLAAT